MNEYIRKKYKDDGVKALSNYKKRWWVKYYYYILPWMKVNNARMLLLWDHGFRFIIINDSMIEPLKVYE